MAWSKKTTIAVGIGAVSALVIAILILKIWRPSDMSTLQGTWIGQQRGAPPGGFILVINGSTMEISSARPGVSWKTTFSLHPEAKPKQIEIAILESPLNDFKGKTIHGISLLKDNTLTLSANEPGNPAFPKSFNQA